MAVIYVSRSPDHGTVQLQFASTEPGIKSDLVEDLRPGETIYGLTFDQLLTATKIEVNKGVGAIVASL